MLIILQYMQYLWIRIFGALKSTYLKTKNLNIFKFVLNVCIIELLSVDDERKK